MFPNRGGGRSGARGAGVLAWRIFLPALERHVDRKADDTALRMEQLLRQRIAQGFSETIDALREILLGRAGQVARSTADIFGDSVRREFALHTGGGRLRVPCR